MPVHSPELTLPVDVIPHRPPHLWLDGVVALNPGVSAQGFWTPGAEHYDGHFNADLRILPGVKILESLAQLGAYALISESEQPMVPILGGIMDAKFTSPVRPGDILDTFVNITDRDRRSFVGKGMAVVDGEVVCDTLISGLIVSPRTANALLKRR